MAWLARGLSHVLSRCRGMGGFPGPLRYMGGWHGHGARHHQSPYPMATHHHGQVNERRLGVWVGSLLKLKQYAHRDREAAGNLPSFHRHVRVPEYIMHPPFTCQPSLPYTASLPRWLPLQLCLPLRGSLLPSMPYMVNPLLHVNIRCHSNFEKFSLYQPTYGHFIQ